VADVPTDATSDEAVAAPDVGVMPDSATESPVVEAPDLGARFRVDELGRMSPAEKILAGLRMSLPADAPGHMPPARFRDLSPEEIQLARSELETCANAQ
jgi:hypothetical protein